MLLASSLTVMAGAIISPALPGITAAFADTPRIEMLAAMMLALPSLLVALGSPLAGLFIDRFGRRPLIIMSLLAYGFSGSSGLYLDSLTGVLVGRALLGLSVAGVMTSATTLIADNFTGAARGRFMGIQAGFLGLGGFVFLLTGGALADINWRAPFAIYLVAIPLVPAAWLWIKEPCNAAHAHAQSPQGTKGPPSGRVMALLFATAFLGMIFFYILAIQLPFALDRQMSASGWQVGLLLAVMTLFNATSSLVYQVVRTRIGFHGDLVATFALVTIGFAILAPATSYVQVLIALAVVGLGFGQLLPNLNMWMSTIAPPDKRGRLLGTLSTALFMGQFVSPLVARPFVTAGGYWGKGGIFAISAAASALVTIGVGVTAVVSHHRRSCTSRATSSIVTGTDKGD